MQTPTISPTSPTYLAAELRLPTNWLDYTLLGIYFVVVLGIGFAARRSVKTTLDLFLSGRSLPAWVTGLAFISANLGAIEVIGMSANGANFGIPTVHYFWVGAVPAMLFLFFFLELVDFIVELRERPGRTLASLAVALPCNEDRSPETV